MYGYALETRAQHVPVAVLNRDALPPGRQLPTRIARSTLFAVRDSYTSGDEIEAGIRNGWIRAGIEIPFRYSSDLLYLRKPVIRVWVDGADAATSNFLLAAFDSLGLEAGAAQAQAAAAAVTQAEHGIQVESHVLGNSGGRTSAYLVPGLITILVQTIVVLLMALSIAAERERGTLEQLLVTRIGKDAIILGKAAAVPAIGFIECVALTLLMRYLFVIPVAGSIWLLLSIVPFLILLPLGLGLLMAAARNHSHAIQMANLAWTGILAVVLLPADFLALRRSFDR